LVQLQISVGLDTTRNSSKDSVRLIVLIFHRISVESFLSFSGRITSSAVLSQTGAQPKDVVFGLGAHTVTATLLAFSIRIVT
jgi:hypothetical protein